MVNVDSHLAKTPCEEEGRDKGVASVRQGTPKVACRAPETKREAWNRFTALKGNPSYQQWWTFISFQNCEANIFLFCQLPSLWHFVMAALANKCPLQFSSVQFSCSNMSDSSWTCELQHTTSWNEFKRLKGWDGVGGGRKVQEGRDVYLWLIHVDVWVKPT